MKGVFQGVFPQPWAAGLRESGKVIGHVRGLAQQFAAWARIFPSTGDGSRTQNPLCHPPRLDYARAAPLRMKRRLFPVLLLVGGATACSPLPREDEAAVFGIIQENLQAMQKEDLAGVMATVHSQGENLAATRAVIEEIFAKYDFRYTLSDLKVTGARNGVVRVSFVQRTERTGGADDRPDNIVEGIHLLKKDGAQWKLLGTVADRVTPLHPP
jgi:hypothetical protein